MIIDFSGPDEMSFGKALSDPDGLTVLFVEQQQKCQVRQQLLAIKKAKYMSRRRALDKDRLVSSAARANAAMKRKRRLSSNFNETVRDMREEYSTAQIVESHVSVAGNDGQQKALKKDKCYQSDLASAYIKAWRNYFPCLLLTATQLKTSYSWSTKKMSGLSFAVTSF